MWWMEYLSFRVAGVEKSFEQAKCKDSRIVVLQLVDDDIFPEVPHDDDARAGCRIQQIVVDENGQNPAMVNVHLIEQLQVGRTPNIDYAALTGGVHAAFVHLNELDVALWPVWLG